MDNVEYWTKQEVWAIALHNVRVVVSTPAILNQALNHGFVSIHGLSLLVFDEAHHCVGRAPMNSIMKGHYHPHNVFDSGRELPHILGLSASPITKKKTEEVAELERNLNAVCKSPFQQSDEYSTFVNMPKLLTLMPTNAPHPTSDLLIALTGIVSGLHIDQDPQTRYLCDSNSPYAREKLEKILKKQCTPAMEEMQSLVRSCTDIQQNLGSGPCDMYIKKCVEKAVLAVSGSLDFTTTESSPAAKNTFFASTLQLLHEKLHMATLSSETSSKVKTLLEYLHDNYTPDLRCLIFVKTRPTAWALTEIINNHPLTQVQYQSFSFVGVSNPTHKGVFDFAELRDQHDNLELFRRGVLNACVATSVLEEGVDVPAMNLVVCFDERPNFRSFIQSRGRARQRQSQFVTFPDATPKNKQWQSLEDEMKEECLKYLDGTKGKGEVEFIDQGEDEVFRVESTG